MGDMRLFTSLLLLTVFFSSTVFAQGEPELDFKRVTNRKGARINNCGELFTGELAGEVSHLRILPNRKIKVYPSSLRRKAKRLRRPDKRNRFFSCDQDQTGSDLLYAKRNRNSETINEIALTDADFPELPERDNSNGINRQCGRIQGWPGSLIYKTIGSSHFPSSDPRRNAIGIIAKPGSGRNWPGTLQVYNVEGEQMATLGLYATGGEWAARYYAGCCGASRINGRELASQASRTTSSRNDDVYVKFGSTCYGPIDADTCRGSSQC